MEDFPFLLTPPVIFRLRLARSRRRAVPTGHSRSSGIVSVACSVQAEKYCALLKAAFAVLGRHIGVVSVTDCEVLRAERI